jgi:hypothetical protein
MNTLSPQISQTPAVLSFNYETFKAQLEEQLAQYRTVVTQDSVKEARELATELNKLKTELDAQRKDAIKFVSAPIKHADDQMKECVGLVATGRQEILDQIAKFDQARLDGLRDELIAYRQYLRTDAEILPEFLGTADNLDDLVKLGSLTKKDRLTDKAVQAVADRVNAELQLQQSVERRLLELENASYRAGLSSPLERAHVEHFLFADKEAYDTKLANLLDVEVDRQRSYEAKILDNVYREQEQAHKQRQAYLERGDRLFYGDGEKQKAPEPELAKPTEPELQAQAAQEAPPAREENGAQLSSGSERHYISVSMVATLPEGMSEADVQDQFREFIEGPGNVRVEWIDAAREDQENAA